MPDNVKLTIKANQDRDFSTFQDNSSKIKSGSLFFSTQINCSRVFIEEAILHMFNCLVSSLEINFNMYGSISECYYVH